MEDEGVKIGDRYEPKNRPPSINPLESILQWEHPEQYLKDLLRRPEVTADDTYSGGSHVNPDFFNNSLWLNITPDGLFVLSGNEDRRYNMSTTEKLELFRYSET